MYSFFALSFVTVLLFTVRAELPPWVYEEMKRNAQEVLVLHVDTVAAWPPCDESEPWCDPCEEYFDVDATVKGVNRTWADFHEGDTVSFETYVRSWTDECFLPGPSSPIELTPRDCILAYMNHIKGEEPNVLALGAGGQSFEPLENGQCVNGMEECLAALSKLESCFASCL